MGSVLLFICTIVFRDGDIEQVAKTRLIVKIMIASLAKGEGGLRLLGEVLRLVCADVLDSSRTHYRMWFWDVVRVSSAGLKIHAYQARVVLHTLCLLDHCKKLMSLA